MATQTFGEKLRALRRASKVTQRELAHQVGVDFSYISKLENDRLPPPAADTLLSICEVLDVNPDELLALTGKLPSDIQETVGKSRVAQRFLREAQRLDLNDEDWEKMIKSLKEMRGE